MEMFDHRLWRDMRTRYAADGTFPTIYEKVKPEMDPLQFLEEERSWAEQAKDRSPEADALAAFGPLE
jgi:hypothetical protein